MSASTNIGQTGSNTNLPARRKRGPNKTKGKTGAVKNAANPPAGVAIIQPTQARAAAMSARSGAALPASNGIASGFAATLLTASPGWSAEYQKTFIGSLTAALPLICAAPIAKAA